MGEITKIKFEVYLRHMLLNVVIKLSSDHETRTVLVMEEPTVPLSAVSKS